MTPSLRARLEFAAAKLAQTAAVVGVPAAVQGAHLAGPTRGHSVVVLDIDLAELLRDVLAAVPAPEAPISEDVLPPLDRILGAGEKPPVSKRFRNLEFED